jgi:CBS domain-containing protein|tara:strand:- start:2003 stop:2449 length:447 start_codon:yes stop_codon:yes gene_type:complete
MKTGIKVIDAMTKAPLIVKPDEKLINCAKKMVEGDVGSLMVVENDKPLGILTEKDFIIKVLAPNLDTEKTTVKEVMSTTLVKIQPDLDLYDAILFMSREDVRRLPVISNEKLIGLLTYKDILKIQPDLYDIFIENFKIKEEKTKLTLL